MNALSEYAFLEYSPQLPKKKIFQPTYQPKSYMAFMGKFKGLANAFNTKFG